MRGARSAPSTRGTHGANGALTDRHAGSRLALWQANAVREALDDLAEGPADAIEIVPITTSGDRIRDRSLADSGGKGLFTKEIEQALLAGDIDLAVHSAKDMQTFLPEGLVIGAYLEREDVRDALISREGQSLEALRQGARIGTAALRREALLRRARPDFRMELLRGNVPTRLKRVEAGDFDATLLAAAGLKRLGLEGHITALLPLDAFPPSCGQGAIAIECRESDGRIRDLLAGIDHRATAAAVGCERAFLGVLDGTCRTPIAGYARMENGAFRFDGLILSEDGTEFYAVSSAGDPAAAAEIGRAAGEELRRRTPAAFLERLGIG